LRKIYTERVQRLNWSWRTEEMIRIKLSASL